MNRRTAAGLVVIGGSALVAAGVGVPAMIAGISPAFVPRRERWRRIGKLSEFPVGKVSRSAVQVDREEWPHQVGEKTVFVWRRSETDLVVFSRSCTDLGCPLDYEPGSGCYLCPCHGGIFSQEGQPLAGPPKTPMHRYTHRMLAAALEIDLSSVSPAA
jgi:menaquinol-cytochrome c reductase iron-sulfur subunit